MVTNENKNNPLAAVFGFPTFNNSDKTKRYRDKKLCPFNNKAPNCTKDKANNPFDAFTKAPSTSFDWKAGYNYPKPDYLSSSRKRLIPQMLFKGGIFKSWNKKQAVALQKSFFETLPELPQVKKEKADIAWFLYDLVLDKSARKYNLTSVETIYTEFEPALLKITTPEASNIHEFISLLQDRLDERLEGNAPDAPSLKDILSQ
ncbi:MAG: NotI family restriction endonuclease [Deltaproteobacteria bacterium]